MTSWVVLRHLRALWMIVKTYRSTKFEAKISAEKKSLVVDNDVAKTASNISKVSFLLIPK